MHKGNFNHFSPFSGISMRINYFFRSFKYGWCAKGFFNKTHWWNPLPEIIDFNRPVVVPLLAARSTVVESIVKKQRDRQKHTHESFSNFMWQSVQKKDVILGNCLIVNRISVILLQNKEIIILYQKSPSWGVSHLSLFSVLSKHSLSYLSDAT